MGKKLLDRPDGQSVTPHDREGTLPVVLLRQRLNRGHPCPFVVDTTSLAVHDDSTKAPRRPSPTWQTPRWKPYMKWQADKMRSYLTYIKWIPTNGQNKKIGLVRTSREPCRGRFYGPGQMTN